MLEQCSRPTWTTRLLELAFLLVAAGPFHGHGRSLISEDVADGKHVPLHTESESVAGLLRSKLRSLSSSSDFTWLAKEKPEFSIFELFHDAPRHRQDSHRLVKWGIAFFGVMLAVALVIMALMMIGACVLRQAVQSGIEKPYDWKEVLGVDVELEGFVSPFTGMVEVKNLLLRNPPGHRTYLRLCNSHQLRRAQLRYQKQGHWKNASTLHRCR